jgi:hypothetical protein
MKTCTGCQQQLPLTEFGRERQWRRTRVDEVPPEGFYDLCRSCTKKQGARRNYEANREAYIAQAAQWKRDNPEAWKAKARDYARRKRWAALGVTEEIYDQFIEECGDACNGCRRPFGDDLYACVDHDHDTGAPRGLLCSPCNLAVGHAYDDPNRLEALAAYLRRHGKS